MQSIPERLKFRRGYRKPSWGHVKAHLHLNYPRTGKQSSGLGIAFDRRDPSIDKRILDIGMA
jgi:hypothetical protein